MQILWRRCRGCKNSRALHLRTKTSTSFVRERSGTLLSSMSWCSPNLLLKLEKSQFRAHYPGFSRVLKEKIHPCYGSHEALYGWHTWRRRLHDFWWVGSAKLTFVNLVLEKTTSLQNVVVHGQPTKSFPSALHVADNYTCGLWPSMQTNSYSASFSISDLKLSSTVEARVEVRVLFCPQNDWLTNLRLHGGIDIIFFRCQKQWKPSMLSSSR